MEKELIACWIRNNQQQKLQIRSKYTREERTTREGRRAGESEDTQPFIF